MLECPACEGSVSNDGRPCKACGGRGDWALTECPKAFVGHEMIEPINFAGWAMKGDWPVTGGLLDQSAWFVSMVGQLESAQNQIDAERAKRS